jgi:hypothetical protein
MQAIVAFWRLASSANIKPNCLTNVNVLIRTFRNAPTNDGEILLLIAAGCVRINKGCPARHQCTTADNVLFHFL